MIRLRQIREDNKESQSELAAFLGVTFQSVGNWENENREMDYDTLARIAHHYNVSVDYLLGFDYDLRELSITEREYLGLYRDITPRCKDMVIQLAKALKEYENAK